MIINTEKWIEILLWAAGVSSLAILGSIFLFLLLTAVQMVGKVPAADFFFGTVWNPSAFREEQFGILALFVGTVMVAGGAIIIALPIGMGTAIYLSEIASERTREFAKPAIEMLSAFPSVVLGLLGIVIIAPAISQLFGLSSGLNALCAAIIVAIMILPTMISISEDVLTSLPLDFRSASQALGATRWQMIWHTLLPAAAPGLFAAMMLGVGRAVGETMAVLMIAGNARAFPHSLLDPVQPITAVIAMEIKEVVYGSTHYYALFAVGFVLFMITFAINLVADLIVERQLREYQW